MSTTGRDAVLVIDDHDVMLDALVALLTTHGYEAVGTNSASTALGLVRDGAIRPRLILLDLNMPGMDGWKFRAEMLCDPNLATIPVIVVSAAGRLAVRAAAEAMHAAAGLVKPIDADELLRLVATVTGDGAR